MRRPGSVQRRETLLLAVTGLGHGQKGTARAVLDELTRKRETRMELCDLDEALTGTDLFSAARAPGPIADSTLEKVRRQVGRAPIAAAAFDPMAARLCAQALPDVPLALVQCGLVTATRWPWERADLVLVPDEPASRVFLAQGGDPGRIVPLGLPLCPGFAEGALLEKLEARDRLGLDPERPMVLLSAEDLWTFEVEKAALQMAAPRGVLQVAVDLGADLDAAEALDEQPQAQGQDVHAFGKTDLAPVWWAAADLVVCHPSDHVVSRALALGKPVVTLPPHGPSAKRVVRAIEAREAGLSCAEWGDLGPTLTRALSLQPRWERSTGPYRGGGAVRRMATALQGFLNRRVHASASAGPRSRLKEDEDR